MTRQRGNEAENSLSPWASKSSKACLSTKLIPHSRPVFSSRIVYMPSRRKKTEFKPRNILCPVKDCPELFMSKSGCTRHVNSTHRSLPPELSQDKNTLHSDQPDHASGGSSPPQFQDDFYSSPAPEDLPPDSRIMHDHDDGSRIEYHGYLDGMKVSYFGCMHTFLIAPTHSQELHVTPVATIYLMMHRLHQCHSCQPMTGSPSTTVLIWSWRTFSTARIRFLKQDLTS